MRVGPGLRVVVAEQGLHPRVGVPGIREPARQHQQPAGSHPPVHAIVTVAGMRVRVVVVVHMLAALVGVHTEAGRRDHRDDGRGGEHGRIVGDIHAAADEIELEIEDAGHCQHVTDERRFVGAVHPVHVQSQFGAARGGHWGLGLKAPAIVCRLPSTG